MHYSTKDYSRAIKIRFYVLEYNELEKMDVTFIFSFITRLILFLITISTKH